MPAVQHGVNAVNQEHSEHFCALLPAGVRREGWDLPGQGCVSSPPVIASREPGTAGADSSPPEAGTKIGQLRCVLQAPFALLRGGGAGRSTGALWGSRLPCGTASQVRWPCCRHSPRAWDGVEGSTLQAARVFPCAFFCPFFPYLTQLISHKRNVSVKRGSVWASLKDSSW